jgi:hypothetical protein
MHPKTGLVFALALVGALGAAGVAARILNPARPLPAHAPAVTGAPQPGDRQPAQLARIDGALGGLAATQTRQELRIAALQQELRELTRRARDESAPHDSAVRPTSGRDPDELAREHFEALTGRALAEPRDERWSAEAARHLADLFTRADFQASRIARLDCRSTLCAASIQHDDEASREAFLQAFPHAVGWNFDFQMRFHAQNGVVSSELVMTRDGVSMPSD